MTSLTAFEFNGTKHFNLLELEPTRDFYGDICKTSVFTMSMWIRPDSVADETVLDLNGMVSYNLLNGWTVNDGVNTPITAGTSVTGDGSTWQHIALVSNGEAWTGYLNGSAELTGTAEPLLFAPLLSGAYMVVGGESAGGVAATGRHYNGLLRNFQIYHRPVSTDEVALLYANGESGVAAALPGVYDTSIHTAWVGKHRDYTASVSAYVDIASPCNVLVPDHTLVTPDYPSAADVDAGTGAFDTVRLTDNKAVTYEFGSQAASEYALVPGTPYRFFVTDVDEEGTPATVTTKVEQATTGTFAVHDLRAVTTSHTDVSIDWLAATPDVCTTSVSAYKEDLTAVHTHTVINDGGVLFSPAITAFNVGDRYEFDVSSATMSGTTLQFTATDGDPTTHNTLVVGDAGTAGARVMFTPRVIGQVWAFFKETAFGDGEWSAAYDVEGASSLAVYGANATVGDTALVEKVDFAAGASNMVYGDSNNFTSAALLAGEYYHFYAYHQHPAGLLTPKPSHFAVNTNYYDLQTFSAVSTSESNVTLEWSTTEPVAVGSASLLIAAYTTGKTWANSEELYVSYLRGEAASAAFIDARALTDFTSAAFGDGTYGEASLEADVTYYLYAVARSPAGVLSSVILTDTAPTSVLRAFVDSGYFLDDDIEGATGGASYPSTTTATF